MIDNMTQENAGSEDNAKKISRRAMLKSTATALLMPFVPAFAADSWGNDEAMEEKELKDVLRQVIREKRPTIDYDYSLELPLLISKLRAVAQSLFFAAEMDNCEGFTNQELSGLSQILFEIGYNLAEMNDTMYPSKRQTASDA